MPSVVAGIETTMASVAVGAAVATTDKIDVGAAIIEDNAAETSDTILDTSESTSGRIVGAEVGAAIKGKSAATGDELVAAAAKAVMTPFGPNVMGVSEDVVAAAAPEVSSVLDVAAAD
jgi:hypothetical protein